MNPAVEVPTEIAIDSVAEAPADDLIGTSLGRYTLIRLLGVGGMGRVYLARDADLERRVAVKVLSSDLTNDEGLVQRFRQEARAASALNHPNVLTVFEVGKFESMHFISTEFIEGEALQARMSQGRMVARDAIDVAIQVASALSCAHQAGIIHRDIKPQNVMIRSDGHAKVIDFGLAKLFDRPPGSPRLTMVETQPGVVMGTPAYMSPEQIRGMPLDERSDIFSFGVLLYEMFTGRLPFTGSNIGDIVASVLREEQGPVSRLAPEAPSELDQIVNKALQKEREHRYQKIQELLIVLQALKRKLEFQEAQREAGLLTAVQSEPQRAVNLRGHVRLKGTAELDLSTSFIGREKEIAELGRLLRQEDTRLVTMTGMGGVGKTRLAMHVAEEFADRFPGGVYVVPLVAITDAELVISAIAQTVGVKESPDRALADQLKQRLHNSQALLVLDNFEQALSAAPFVAELITFCPRLTVLVTSRTVLRLRGEREFEVPPLDLPDLRSEASIEYLATCPSVLLFVERARLSGFVISNENIMTAAEICVRLDGIPLAIELAAPRVRTISPQELLRRLEKRLELLTRGSTELPVRQKTMRATIAWSYDLLDKKEKSLFRQLAIFVGGFTLEAAEAVCLSESRMSVLDGVSSLLDNSLLRKDADKLHFVMLETIREFALERLSETRAAQLRERHSSYFSDLTERVEPELTGNAQLAWLNVLETDRENLRAALNWSIAASRLEVGLRIAAASWRFWEVNGPLSEGRRWLSAFLAKATSASVPDWVLAKALYAAGILAHIQSKHDEAHPLLERALNLYRSLGNSRGVADTLNDLGLLLHDLGDNQRAEELLQEGLSMSRESIYMGGMAYALDNLGHVARDRGNYEESRSFHQQSVAIRRELGDDFAVAASINNGALVALAQGDLDSAYSGFEESGRMFQTLKNKLGEAISLNNLGEVAELQRNDKRAATLYNRSLALFRKEEDAANVATVLKNLGNIARREREPKEAKKLYAESLTLLKEAEHTSLIPACLEALAALACVEAKPERAAELLSAASSLREKQGIPLPPSHRGEYEQTLSYTRNALSANTFAAAWSRGEQMTLEQVTAGALE